MRLKTTLTEVLVVFGVICGLAVMGLGKRAEFENEARRRGCISHQNALRKAVLLWESQNKPLPGGELFLEVRIDGRIARASPELEALGLKAGSTVLADLVKDRWVFACPARVKHLLDRSDMASYDEVCRKVVETHYRFSSRGVSCLLYGAGQRESSELAHGTVP